MGKLTEELEKIPTADTLYKEIITGNIDITDKHTKSMELGEMNGQVTIHTIKGICSC